MKAEQFLALVLINALWQSLLIAVAAWFVLRVMLRTNATLRYGIWFTALLACAVFPLLTTAGSAGISMPIVVIDVVDMLWAIVAVTLLFRIAWSISTLQRAKRTALPMSPRDRAGLRHWNTGVRGIRDPRLCVSPDIDSPAAVGLFDAMVLLPEWTLESHPRDLDGIVIHELAHLRRYDDWTTLAESVIQALLFFNPAVRWIAAQLDVEREIACDDAAVAGADPVAYAECLTGIAKQISCSRPFTLAPSWFATRRILSLRVERLLEHPNGGTSSPLKVVLLTTVAFTAVLWASFILVPLASIALGAPQDDMVVHTHAAAIYKSLQHGDPRFRASGPGFARMGSLSSLQLIGRESTAQGSFFRYRGLAAHGDVSMQVRTDRRDHVIGFTVEASGTNDKRKAITAYAWYSGNAADLRSL